MLSFHGCRAAATRGWLGAGSDPRCGGAAGSLRRQAHVLRCNVPRSPMLTPTSPDPTGGRGAPQCASRLFGSVVWVCVGVSVLGGCELRRGPDGPWPLRAVPPPSPSPPPPTAAPRPPGLPTPPATA